MHDHEITGIEVTGRQVFHNEEWIEILKLRILERQAVDVDTITGATVSSKAFLKAVENALGGN